MNKLVKLPLFLGAVGCICGGVLAAVNFITEPVIAANEEKKANAVEIELPQVCAYNDYLLEHLFKLYLYDKNIDTIILHPYFLCSNFKEIIKESGIIVKYTFLDVSFEERVKRIKKRSKDINSKCEIFSLAVLKNEEVYYREFKKLINKNHTSIC